MFIGWYLIGFISHSLFSYSVCKRFTYRDLLLSLIVGSSGLIVLLAVVFVALDEFVSKNIDLDKPIFKKKMKQ